MVTTPQCPPEDNPPRPPPPKKNHPEYGHKNALLYYVISLQRLCFWLRACDEGQLCRHCHLIVWICQLQTESLIYFDSVSGSWLQPLISGVSLGAARSLNSHVFKIFKSIYLTCNQGRAENPASEARVCVFVYVRARACIRVSCPAFLQDVEQS